MKKYNFFIFDFSAAGENFLAVYGVYTDFTLILYEKMHLWLALGKNKNLKIPATFN
jgi:hypothetical protein